jgi:hypothetical protein
MSNRPGAPDASSPPLQSRFSWFCLTVGQVVSFLGCVAGPIGAVAELLGGVEPLDGPQPGGPRGATAFRIVAILIVAPAAFCFSAAMYIVFTHVKQLLGPCSVSGQRLSVSPALIRFFIALLAAGLFALMYFGR